MSDVVLVGKPTEINVKDLHGMETNEISREANGGTEMMLRRLHDTIPPDLMKGFQVIPTRVRELDPNRKRILWIHDTHMDPEVQHLHDKESVDRFERIVFVSYVQRALFVERFGLPYEKCVVIPNAIEPFDLELVKPTIEPLRLIYHTTPHRGLNILVAVFKELSKTYDMRLDVFSSFEIYGQKKRDELYEPLFEDCRNTTNIRYHGYRPNEEVRECLEKAHVFAYPCTWMETSCIAAIEALCAGCLVLTSDYGALPETISHYGFTYQYTDNVNKHATRFMGNLESMIKLIKNKEAIRDYLMEQRQVFNGLYDWEHVSKTWVKMLNDLSKEP